MSSSVKRTETGNIDPLATIGGVRGLIESILPGFLFMMVFAFTQELNPALIASVAAGVVFAGIRIATRGQLMPALAGLGGIVLCAIFAKLGGTARDYYVPGFITNVVSILVLGVSMVVKWPVAGLLLGFLHGEELTWREKSGRLKVYQTATLLVLSLFALRLLVQVPLYFADAVAALGAARLVMGVPLYAGVLVLAWVMTRPCGAPDKPAVHTATQRADTDQGPDSSSSQPPISN